MAERLRQFAQRLKEKVQFPVLQGTNKEKVDQLITKYVPAQRMTEMAEKIKHEAITKRVRDLVTKYEKFTGVAEIMALQNTVVEAQDKFIAAQDRRRELGRELANIEARLKELHAEMQNTMKGDDKYLHMCTEEHKLIIQERSLRAQFSEAEREERELFATMSAAVKLGHERERAHADRNKYWYIVASIFGTVLGIAGSTINNHLKMSEFRNMMEQQMARSASVLYTIAGGAGGVPENRPDIADAMKTEFAYQEQLAENLREMQENINHLVDKQSSLIGHLHRQEEIMEKQMRELKKIVVVASQTSAKSDAELAQILAAVHHDLDEVEKDKDTKPTKAMDPNQVLTGIGIIICAAVIFGNLIGRIS